MTNTDEKELSSIRNRSVKIVKHNKRDFFRSVEMAQLIHKFGGVKRIAKICECSEANVYKWVDHVTGEPAWRLLAYARRKNMNDVTLKMIRPDLDFGIKRETKADVEIIPQ